MKLNQRPNEKGFTLIEVLLVLTLISTLIVLIAPIHVQQVNIQEEKQFLELLEFDILYTQSLSIMENEEVKIIFKNNEYVIVQGIKGSRLLARRIPKGWTVNLNGLTSIAFDEKGKIRQPGTFKIHTNTSSYNVVFPFGKGRGYIVKN